jgi:SAM-dependent methyltransferase
VTAAKKRRDPAWGIEHNNITGRVAYLERGVIQSAADSNGVSLGDYIHAMYAFIRQRACRDVLMIGCGGGTLATMLSRAGVKVTMVDINPRSFEIARRYFCLPDGVACHVDDGAAFLRRHHTRYDAIVLDAYDGRDIPAQFRRRAFFALARSRLRPGRALFLANMVVEDDDDRRPDRFAVLMRQTWRDVRILDSEDWTKRNAVLAAGSVRTLRRPRLLVPPKRYAKAIAAELKSMNFRAIRT